MYFVYSNAMLRQAFWKQSLFQILFTIVFKMHYIYSLEVVTVFGKKLVQNQLK